MVSEKVLPESTIRVDRIGQVAITVSDLASAKSFYQDQLGLKFLFDAGKMSFLQCGEIRFMIGASEEPCPRGGTIIYFAVPDIHAAHANLSEQGVEFVQGPHLVARMASHDLWMAFLKDPDGNVLGLMSEIARG
ncbi:MAG: VOC family protein [Terracidiphilus sp.]